MSITTLGSNFSEVDGDILSSFLEQGAMVWYAIRMALTILTLSGLLVHRILPYIG